jgi:hypothetical protein
MAEWKKLTELYKGWTLTEVKELSPRERDNWLKISQLKS